MVSHFDAAALFLISYFVSEVVDSEAPQLKQHGNWCSSQVVQQPGGAASQCSQIMKLGGALSNPALSGRYA